MKHLYSRITALSLLIGFLVATQAVARPPRFDYRRGLNYAANNLVDQIEDFNGALWRAPDYSFGSWYSSMEKQRLLQMTGELLSEAQQFQSAAAYANGPFRLQAEFNDIVQVFYWLDAQMDRQHRGSFLQAEWMDVEQAFRGVSFHMNNQMPDRPIYHPGMPRPPRYGHPGFGGGGRPGYGHPGHGGGFGGGHHHGRPGGWNR